MLGLLLIYFIGKNYYQLAGEHGKSSWGFASLGVLTYYAGTFLFGFLFGVTIELVSPGTIDGLNDFVLGLIALPFGVLSTVGLYLLLRRSWVANRNDAIEIMDPKQN
jgi:hypothetical protein